MKKIILFSAMVSAVFVAVSCNVQAVYEEDFDRDVLSSGTWTVNMSGEHSSKACFIADDGVDGNGCIMLSSADRTELYISYPLSGLDPDVLYRMTASVQTEAVKDGRGAVVSVSTDDSEQIWNASEFLYGDNGWKDVYVDFYPSEDGTATLCCRLGFHGGTYNGGTASGRVKYDNVRVLPVSSEQMYFRSGDHIGLAIDRDKISVSDSVMDGWLSNLDRAYDAYEELVGGHPFGGEKIMILTTPGVEEGYWALAGNPILWNNHVDVRGCLQRTGDMDDWNFGILHEIAHTFSGWKIQSRDDCAADGDGYTNSAWNWNDEIFANFRMSYALEMCGGKVVQDTAYVGKYIIEYYRKAYDKTIGKGIPQNNGDALHFTFLRIKEKYGWDVYKKAFRALYALPSAKTRHLKTDFEKLMFFLSAVSDAAGENVLETCYTKEEISLIEQSLK